MTQRDIQAYLFDIVEACDAIASFIAAQTLADYLESKLLRSAVERQAIIIGEALAQIRRFWPEYVDNVSDMSAIVSFRNQVVHGYFGISPATVWDIATVHVPAFRQQIAMLLAEIPD